MDKKNYASRYSLGNCLYEATLQRIERDCNCLPVNFLDVEGLDNDLEACAGPSKVCMNRLINKIGTEKYIVDPKDGDTVKECLNSCVDQTGSYLLTQSAYPNKESFHR